MPDLKPYATVKPLMGPGDSWLTGDDVDRLNAYSVYEGIYENVPDSFKLVQRGSESQPLYLPNAMTIVEAVNRYLAKRWTYALDPKIGAEGDREALGAALQRIFKRERLRSKFNTQKRWGLVRGDSVWHIVADEEKDPGSRISIYETDPASYFPIEDPWNPEKILGVHLVDPVVNADGKTVIKRQTYRKTETGRISYEVTWWEAGAWDDREGQELKKVSGKDIPEGQEAVSVFELDPRITSIPVYHVKNKPKPGAPFGTSEIAGFETLIASVNQSISDEELSLALEGLGLYATTSGPPTDEEGAEINWQLGPGWVVEIDEDSEFKRVNGVSSVAPYQAHIAKVEESMRQAAGVPNIAIGAVDTQVAESGIALAFHMAPILAANEEKEEEILGVMDQFLYDLTTMWLPVYEQVDSPARAASIVDSPLPVNRKATLEEIVAMLSTDPPIISVEYARTLLSERLGYDFPDEMGAAAVAEAAAFAEARNVDPFAARVAGSLEDEGAEG